MKVMTIKIMECINVGNTSLSTRVWDGRGDPMHAPRLSHHHLCSQLPRLERGGKISSCSALWEIPFSPLPAVFPRALESGWGHFFCSLGLGFSRVLTFLSSGRIWRDFLKKMVLR